jgi:hypothetical protein
MLCLELLADILRVVLLDETNAHWSGVVAGEGLSNVA